MMKRSSVRQAVGREVRFVIFILLSVVFLAPIFIVFYNSWKGSLYISDMPFALPNRESFVGFYNYFSGVEKIGFFSAFGWSLFLTVGSVFLLVLCCSMTAWYLVRQNSTVCKFLYYLFVFSMVVPFQMVMFTSAKMANILHLDHPLGLLVFYLGFGSGLSVFLFSGFLRSIPREIEEAAMIDGCPVIRLFFSVIFPIVRPIAVTVAILNAMWVWNDYLLPYLIIGSDYQTIPIAIQYLRGGYGSIDLGSMMAMLVLAIVPIVIFYFSSQRYIIAGVVAGAVKG